MTIILSPISKSFSQTGIKQSDTIVGLKEPVARLVIKDLIDYDGKKLENEKLYELNEKYKKENNLLEEKVKLDQNKSSELNSIIDFERQKFTLENNKSKELEVSFKKQKRRTLLFQITTFVATVAAGVFLIK